MKTSVVFYVNFLVIIGIELANTSSLIGANIDLCGPENELHLTEHGETSSMIVTLQPNQPRTVCKLHVTAPKTYTINMDFIESTSSNQSDDRQEDHPPCVMSIILPENPRIPVWKGDPCSTDQLTDVDLLTPDFKIIWSPPSNRSFTKGRKFVLTAVGQGAVCKEPGQHTCMKIGWDPMLCISDYLLCDGIKNCPKSSTSSDEDEKLCKTQLYAQTTWEQIAVEIFKKFRSSDLINNNKWLHDKLDETTTTKKLQSDWNDWEEVQAIETTTKKVVMEGKKKAVDSISQILSKYGPWGYLMLGMLICGTVLMFCGLWECCFRRPKNPMESGPSQTQPTTVLIINQQDEVASPPNYDDLDQPPSYTTLFPNYKPNDTDEPSVSNVNNDNNNNNSSSSSSSSASSDNQQQRQEAVDEQQHQQQVQEEQDCDDET